MEFQYASIGRGGHSIIERLQREGIDDWQRYISFYNLRNYDRINDSSSTMLEADDGDWETVSACYMDSGVRIEDVPWQGSPEDEMNAYVSEELYVHSKLLIADDQLVICGSANLNDRSQLGIHDSEIAVVIQDPTEVQSYMNGQPYTAGKFAASLRRYITRKHLGLLPDQRWDRPTANWTPIDHHASNEYDWDSRNDELVRDPLGREFIELWERTAQTNTEVFSKVFHNVPNDCVRTWSDYDDFFSKHFIIPGSEDEKAGKNLDGKVYYGHVVPEEFTGGVEEVKDWLRRVRGSLVEMPLGFLADVDDIAKDGLTLNGLTDELYT
jgi:phospholipase D1/2